MSLYEDYKKGQGIYKPILGETGQPDPVDTGLSLYEQYQQGVGIYQTQKTLGAIPNPITSAPAGALEFGTSPSAQPLPAQEDARLRDDAVKAAIKADTWKNFLPAVADTIASPIGAATSSFLLRMPASLIRGIQIASDMFAGKIYGVEGVETKMGHTIADTLNRVADAVDLNTGGNPIDPSFTQQLGSGVGSMLFYLLPGMGAMKGGSLIARYSPMVAKIFATGAMTHLEAQDEASGVYKALRDKGKTVEEATAGASKTYWSNAMVLGATNYLANYFGTPAGAVPALAKRVKQALISAPTEGLQEGVQQMINNYFTGRPITEGVFTSATIGTIIGGGASLTLSGGSPLTETTVPNQPGGLNALKGKTVAQLREEIGRAESVDAQRMIKDGEIPREMVYKEGNILQPKFAENRISDIAQKLDAVQQGLGDKFKGMVDVNNVEMIGNAPEGLVRIANQLIDQAEGAFTVPQPVEKTSTQGGVVEEEAAIVPEEVNQEQTKTDKLLPALAIQNENFYPLATETSGGGVDIAGVEFQAGEIPSAVFDGLVELKSSLPSQSFIQAAPQEALFSTRETLINIQNDISDFVTDRLGESGVDAAKFRQLEAKLDQVIETLQTQISEKIGTTGGTNQPVEVQTEDGLRLEIQPAPKEKQPKPSFGGTKLRVLFKNSPAFQENPVLIVREQPVLGGTGARTGETAKFLTFTSDKQSFKLRAKALGLNEANLKAGQKIKVNPEDIKEKGDNIKIIERVKGVERELGSGVDKFIGETNPEAGMIRLGLSMEEVRTAPGQETPDFEFSSPAVEERYQKAKGLNKNEPGLAQRLTQHIVGMFKGLAREYTNLPQTAEYAPLRELLRQNSNKKEVVTDRTVRVLQAITQKLNPKEYDLFTRKLLLDDFAQETAVGHKLPFGFSSTSVLAERGRLNENIASNKNIQEALLKRKQFIEAFQKDLVEAGVLDVSDLKEDYFHHQVLQYAIERPKLMGTGERLKITPHGFTKQRAGSELDINTDYLQSEFEVISQGLLDIEVAKTVKQIEDGQYNIKKDLTQVLNKIKEVEDKTTLKASDFLVGNQEDLNKMIETMVADAKAGSLSTDWHDYIPDGYVAWQPREGNVFYHATTLPEKVVAALQGDLVQELGITKEDLRGTLALGGLRKEFVLKEEVAETLNHLRTFTEEGTIKSFVKGTTKLWKVWILLNPRRAFKYNLQNMAGDLDAVLAGNPGALTHIGQATKELYDVFYANKSMTPDMRDFFERGGLSTNQTVQEIPDISTLKIFEKVLGKTDTRSGVQELGSKLVTGYFDSIKNFSSFRENLMRYAAYLDYSAKLKAGKSTGYGASIIEEIDAITDPKDKAAKLARELLGDYGAISATGKELRETILPFFSWLEINFKRYPRLFKNAFYSDGLSGVGGAVSRAAVGAGVKVAVKLPFLMARMAALWGAFQLFNHLFHDDEEKKLNDYDRSRMHLNLGKDKNGEIQIVRLSGALGDFLSWFGLNDFPTEVKQLQDGQIDWSDIVKERLKAPVNKLAQAVTPLIKIPAEFFSKRSFFPDIFDPTVVRDPYKNTLKVVSLENEYDLLMGKPSRGYLRSWKDTLLTSFDPDEVSYYKIINLKYNFLEKELGTSGSGDFTSERSKVYGAYKQALRFGDKDAQERAIEKMNELGVRAKDLEQSLRAADPLFGLSKENKEKFMEWINGFQKAEVGRAMKYYEEVYRDAPEPNLRSGQAQSSRG